jgi:hypothetical protein
MEYEFYYDFLDGAEEVDVEERQLELFHDDEEFDIDLWARFRLDAGNRKYQVTIMEDSSPNLGNTNYRLKVAEKKPLEIDDGYTNWRRVMDKKYDRHKDAGFEVALGYDLEEVTSLEFDEPQRTF